ncbi:sulfotransferase family 2 domain-containing protein [Aestuariivirga sp.]|jgi:hypothetical protein|uniref:sulfotransferase family 2 domain-containing protein n=1 Tax=Aestuariivirga sp. TaxID=2650926 RepID=UPI0037838F93
MKPRRIGTTLKSEALLRLTPKYSNILFVPSRSLCFFPIPKNANSYLKSLVLYNDKSGGPAFHPQQTTALAHLRSTQDRYKLDSWSRLRANDVIKFAVLRNPYSRLVSCFVDKLVKPAIGLHGGGPVSFAAQSGIAELGSFQHFVETVCAQPDYRRDRYVRSQAHYLNGFPAGSFSHLGAIERLDVTLRFLAGLGFPDLPPDLHSGVVKRTAYNREVPPGAKPVADFSEADFRTFGIPPRKQFADAALEALVRRSFGTDYALWQAAIESD